jgi:diacylglycerol kinase (ATP)
VLGIEIFIAVMVHDRIVRPYVGDSLAVVLVYLVLRAATRLPTAAATALALATAVAIEFGQWAGLLDLLGLGGNPLARVLLGTGFDPYDFIAYAAGGLTIAALERGLSRLRCRVRLELRLWAKQGRAADTDIPAAGHGPREGYKNHGFRRRLGFAIAGIVRTARRERSFRTQLVLGTAAAASTAWLRPAPIWIALLVLAAGLVLALELVNAALEEALDRLHPDHHPAIGAAKDAAAGAVLLASAAAALVGGLMILSCFGG